MGEFNKEVFKSWAEYECKRQIYLHLAKDDRNWIKPFRKLTPLHRARMSKFGAHRVGKIYEKSVFAYLEQTLPNVHVKHLPITGSNTHTGNASSQPGMNQLDIGPFPLDASHLNDLKNKVLADSQAHLVLEASFPASAQLMSSIFSQEDASQLVQHAPKQQRPDILVFQQVNSLLGFNKGQCQELLADGNLRTLTHHDQGRVALNVVDVKASHKEKIGKKYWMELFFYAHGLAFYLKEQGLEQDFAVVTQGHGIFPYFDENLFPEVSSWQELSEHIALLKWKESFRLYSQAKEVFAELAKNKPNPVENVPVHIQPACGRCQFLDDCKESLGMNQSDSSKYDVCLIPNTSASIAEQLKEKNMTTVGDVVKLLPQQAVGDTPDPLYPEKPLLELKANALQERKHYPAEADHLKSMAIPRYSDITFTFNLEHDPVCDRVFNIAFQWSFYLAQNSHQGLYTISKALWHNMYQCLESQEQSFADVITTLSRLGHKHFTAENLNELKDALEVIFNEPGLDLTFTPEEKAKGVLVTINGSYLSPNLEMTSEFELLKHSLGWLNQILNLSTLLENILAVPYEPSKLDSWTLHPKTAIFHWANDALTTFGDLMQRHLKDVLVDPQLANQIERISRWLAPSDSSISNDQHAFKIYDLKLFVENVVGLPFVLNYTWHEIYHELFKVNINQKYWTAHFNYIDFAAWHEAVEEEADYVQKGLFEKLNHACLFKVIAINRLRTHFQSHYRELTYKGHHTLPSKKFEMQGLPDRYHKLAKSWYLYALLDESSAKLEADFIRLNYPEWSIGKLRAAQSNEVKITDIDDKYYRCSLKVHGISTNMKFKEDDSVVLVPESLRYETKTSSYESTIEQIEWLGHESCFAVTMKKKGKLSKGLPHPLYAALQRCKHETWYLYPTTITYWAKRLENSDKPEDGLLSRRSLGDSWLGHYCARRLLGTECLVNQAAQEPKVYNEAEVFMYNPLSFNSLTVQNPVQSLQSPVKYPPDSSQKEAILMAMNHCVSAIQGPPGTGKSQTITALLDEMLIKAQQEGKNLKILVSAFSYQALRVLLDKTSSLDYADGRPSLVKQCKKVFMRSDSQDPAPAHLASDLTGKRGGTWKLDGKGGIITLKSILADHLPDTYIIFAPPNPSYHLGMRWMSKTKNPQELSPFPSGFGFDVILVDEASQLPVDQCLPIAHLLKPQQFKLKANPLELEQSEPESLSSLDLEITSTQNPQDLTKVILVGDHYQLPPVQSFEPPKQLKSILGSAFEYFVNQLEIPFTQLKVNYRSHQDLVAYTRSLGLYPELNAFHLNATKTLSVNQQKLSQYPAWIKDIFVEDRIIHSLTHTQAFDTAVSSLEAELTQKLVLAYYHLSDLKDAEAEHEFWAEGVGVVAPHNAHGKLIIRGIYQELVSGQRTTHLSDSELMKALRNTIFSVEKFQGSDRRIMIASMGISAKSQLQSEEAFIYDLNRFNVLTSRAKSKMILLCSQNYLDYFPQDQDVFEHAAKIRSLVHEFCTQIKPEVEYFDQEGVKHKLSYRYYKA